jgi:AAHS family 4-hydroxybenzoate transporter-like MFS transporter
MKGVRLDRVGSMLQRIAPNEDLSGRAFAMPEKPQAGSPVIRLFDPDLRRGTLFLWLAFFMSLLVIYLLSSWLPTLISSIGMTLKQASLVTAMFQVGGMIGAISLGQMMDRLNPQRVLGVTYGLGAVFTTLIGNSAGSTVVLVVAVLGAGFCVSGAQVGANALAAAFYPTASRATGVSWALGIGRIGSVLGSMAGGWMLALGWGLPTVFSMVGAVALIPGLSLLAMGRFESAARGASVSSTTATR